MKEGTKVWNDEQYQLHPTPNSGIAGWIEKQRHKEIIQVINDFFVRVSVPCTKNSFTSYDFNKVVFQFIFKFSSQINPGIINSFGTQ